MDRILITGGNGFVGGHLVARLRGEDYPLTLAHRLPATESASGSIRSIAVGDIGPGTDWRPALDGCGTVIHLAGRLPGRHAGAADFDAVNDAGTARLVEQAAAAGAKRFIFLSSVAAVADSEASSAVDERTPAAPSLSPYGQSKRAAEGHVASFARDGGVGISIRPPLVYAADAKGTWATLQRLAALGLPLPFGMIRNRRSLIAVENLVDALLAAIAASPSKSVSGAYFVADDKDVGVREVFAWLREGLGLPPRLLPVPVGALRGLLRWTGRDRAAQQLLGDLVIDSSLFRNTFNWMPKLDPRDAITRSGAEYRSVRHSRTM